MTDEVMMAGEEDKSDGSDYALVKEVQKRFKRAEKHSSAWRREAKEDYDFVAGKQWSDEDQDRLKEQLRPVITFNRVGPIIEAVAGSEINNRQEVRYLPRTTDDSGVTDLSSEAARWVRDLCDAEDEESDSFMDATTAGMGWTETWMDYEEDLDGEIRIDRVDPFEMWWDPDAKKRNLSDSRWVMRIKWIAKSDLKAMWPGKYDEAVSKGPWDTEGTQNRNSNTPDEYASSQMNSWEDDPPKDNVKIVEYQWWERETVYRAAQGDKILEFSQEKYNKIKDLTVGTKFLKQTKKVYKRAFIAGDTVLERGLAPCDYGFTFQCITGKRDRNKNTWYGLVRAMRDPQKWANKLYSQILHVINSNAKGGIMAEEDAFANTREAEASWAKSDSITWAKKGAIQRGAIQPKPTVPYPTGLDRLLELAMDGHYSVSGVNLEMLGMADRNQAGVLEYQRRQAGLTILAMMFDSLRRYRKQQGRVLLYFIREYISDGRLIRIVGEEGAKFVELLKDEKTIKYDVIVDEAATSPNQKERTFQIMTQLAPFLMKSGIPMPPELLDYSPLPTSLVEKWKATIKQGGQQIPPEVQKKMEELQKEIEKLQGENVKLKTNQQVDVARLQHDNQMDEAKFVQDVKTTERKLDLKEYETEEKLKIQEKAAKQQR